MLKDGERTTISSRVAELDQIMPQYLGVSEAILDNVIFCHQDESLWPMSEPSVLKKKFDEIFSALKYTKAIENIKVLRKAKGIELTSFKQSEDQFKIDKDRGERAKNRSLAIQAEIEELRTKASKLDEEMKGVQATATVKQREKESYLGILNQLKAKRNRAEERQENVNELRANLEVLDKTDHWLESTLAQYEEKMEAYRAEEETYQQQYKVLQQELSNTRKQLGEKQAEQGQQQAAKENYDMQVISRSKLVKDAARRHELRGYDGDVDETQIREFVERVNKLSLEKIRELERIKKSTDDELGQAQTAMNELDNRKFASTQDKVSAKQTIAANDKKISSLQMDVNGINIDQGSKVRLDSSHTDLKERLQKATTDFNTAAWDQKLQTENTRLRELEDKIEKLNEELGQTVRLAGDRAQLEFTKKELKDRQRSLDAMTATHGDKISSLVDSDWQPSTIERLFQVTLDQKRLAVSEAQVTRDSTSSDLQQLEFKLSTARDSRKKKTEEMKACERAVLNSIIIEGNPLGTVDEYLTELQTIVVDRDTIKGDIVNFGEFKTFYAKCLDTAEQNNTCKLCERKFADAGEKSTAVRKIRAKLAATALDELKEQLQATEEDLKEAQAARPQYEAYKRLYDSEIPAFEREILKSEAQRNTLLSRLEEKDALVGQEEAAMRDVEWLSTTVGTIARYMNEITAFDSEVARLSTQQKSAGAFNVEEIQEQLTACGEQSRTLKAKISKISSDKDRSRTLINSLELDTRDIANKLAAADHQLEKQQNIMSRIQEIKESSAKFRETSQRAEQELDALTPQIATAKQKYASIQQRGREKENEVDKDRLMLSETVNKLKLADDTISAYIDGGGPSKLASCQRAIKTLDQEIARFEAESSKIVSKINKLKEQTDNSERTKRTISDNILYRRNLRALEELQVEIDELESRNATEDYNRLEAEYNQAARRHQTLMAEKGPVLGEMRSKDAELARLLEEWETDYKHSARLYRESHIKVETTKAAIDDLGRYGSALDKAIMKYHSLKMEEINRIAGELWQSTYQGTDVDTILIRSDPENAQSKRTYNYRVCMVKQDAEMDMRGRCSAGQRVLASIIIRLALAECFGVNCGLIALDEPTTNLDRDNIRSLAESLHGIIRARQAQANFQLIVITHDEEFLRYMKVSDFCDTYYHVSRDDKQKSIIQKQDIDQVVN